MSTIESPRDPCADRIQPALTVTPDHAADGTDGTETLIELHAWTPSRDRSIKFIQHPAYRAAAPTALRAA